MQDMSLKRKDGDTVNPATSVATTYDVESEVIERYAEAAGVREAALCCPIDDYDGSLLEVIPQELIEKDYGCGDPTKWVRHGDTVVDLGSGGGKVCYMLSQKVGAEGRVIGVDFNDAMLDLARGYQEEMAEKIGYHNTSFVKAKIQDMRLDLDRVSSYLNEHPVSTVEDLHRFETLRSTWCLSEPAVPSEGVDVVVSNCVLNLVRPEDKTQLFGEIFRVLKKGGSAVISDIVSDEVPTEAIMNDPELWSGCIAGAFTEEGFLEMFTGAGFYGVEVLARSEEPWRTIDGVEFRSVTVRAFKGKEGPCLERNQAILYTGPWSQVRDDDGHTFYRGQRMAVCDKTYQIMTSSSGPYSDHVIGIEPREEIPLDSATSFACHHSAVRDPRVTKGAEYDATFENQAEVCGPDSGCC